MQLLKTISLYYQDAKSDKVYEVDMCQIEPDRCVVNFRYGRRGTRLKEGTKTSQAVSLVQAQAVYDKLVKSKTKEGYKEAPKSISHPNPDPKPLTDINGITSNSHHQAIIQRLVDHNEDKWSIDRAIWRCGELKITEATPILINLIGTGSQIRDYAIAWSLGYCGNDQAINPKGFADSYTILDNWINQTDTPDCIKRIAWEAKFKLADPTTQQQLKQAEIEKLPPELKQLVNQSSDEFTLALTNYLISNHYTRTPILETIYRIDNPTTRKSLIESLKTIAFRPSYFKAIRHIFKIAEYRQDGEIFAIIAKRLEKENSMYHVGRWGSFIKEIGYLENSNQRYNYQTRRYEKVAGKTAYEQEIESPESRIAYNNRTRQYLRKRVWRTLRTLGQDNNLAYVDLATHLLLQYTDSDGTGEKTRQFRKYNYKTHTWENRQKYWPNFANYITFNHILYENSPRFHYPENRLSWSYRPSKTAKDPIPTQREEAFPHLWDQRPEMLLTLLLESHCHLVHQFAAKAIKNNLEKINHQLDITIAIQLLNKPYIETAEIGFEIARNLYNPNNPNIELLISLINCSYEPARNQAHNWIQSQITQLLTDTFLITQIITSQYPDNQAFSRRILNSALIPEEISQLIIARIIAQLLSYQNIESTQLIKEISQTLLMCFSVQLRTLGFTVILDLLNHPLSAVCELGATILLNHQIQSIDLPPDLIISLINSNYEPVRSIGIRIFGQLPDQNLLDHKAMLIAIASHILPDLRQSIRPIIYRLTQLDNTLALELAQEIIKILIKPEKAEGIHQDLIKILQEDLSNWQSLISRTEGLRLLLAKSPFAQDIGGKLLIHHRQNWNNEFTTHELVKLTDHEILSVRQAGREMLLDRITQIKGNTSELKALVRILESRWKDTTEWGRDLLENSLTPTDWTCEVMITLCDSIKQEVRQYGRQLVTRNFTQPDGIDYLLKFSEHPTIDMQTFATNYLTNYASGNLERLQQLKPYFITILCQVNKGRIAKLRIFKFLEQEAVLNQESAMIVAEILTRQSLTISIQDKAQAIKIMLKIKKLYPSIPLPIELKETVQRT